MMGFSRAFALVVVAGGVAVAQPKPSPPTQAQKDKISELAKQAIKKSQAGDHDGAVKDLLDAYAINQSAAVVLLSNVGYELKQMKKPAEALKYFCMYLEKDPGGSAATYVKAEAQTLHTELKLEGEACAKKPEVIKPEPKPDPKPDPNNGQVTGTIQVQPTRPAPVDSGRTMRFAGLGVAGVGVLALGAGIVFGLKAQAKAKQITDGPPNDPNTGMQVSWGPNAALGWDGIVKLEADGNSLQKKQIAFTVLGGAMVVGGVVVYYLGRNKKGTEATSGRTMTVAPAVGPGTAGVTLGGGF